MSDSRCQLCGSTRKNGRLVFDPYFWLKSATIDELHHFAPACTWCDVLKDLHSYCLTPEERAELGVLDWGRQFEPVWRVDGRTVELEIFATGNKPSFHCLKDPPAAARLTQREHFPGSKKKLLSKY